MGLPDKDMTELKFSAHGLPCIAKRMPRLGHWCGYVGIPEEHPLFGKGYDEANRHIQAHGGLTFAEAHAAMEKTDGLWWFGFDCAHSGDLVPGMDSMDFLESAIYDLASRSEAIDGMGGDGEEVYRDINFVKAECESIAKQLAKLDAPNAS
ncbi:MAG: hypothetical protein QNJ62_05010 [Methyloceanibacter sp.]|nr:hypothetical protein [Methyloceanibacter sp.]